MFMINCVKLIFQHQLDKMRKFHGDDTVSTQKDFRSLDKVIDVGHMCQNVVTQQKIGLDSFGNQFPGRLLSKELYNRLHSFFLGRRGNVGGRFDT